MLIDNPEAFKSWLTSVLEPLCDADPEALAKYVYALVKKDKTIEALRQCMVEQLDVFLQAETKPFVELLFKTLETQEYIAPVIPNANPPNPNVPIAVKKEVIPVKPTELIVKDIKPIIPVSTLPNLSEAVNGSVVKKEETTPVRRDRERDHRKSDSEKEDRVRSGRRHRSGSRNRSRSRSWDRGKRSRSRERSQERTRERIVERDRRERNRPWRNKSPPRRYERRRSRSGSPPGVRIRSRSRSPKYPYRDRVRSEKDKKDSKIDKDSKEPNSGTVMGNSDRPGPVGPQTAQSFAAKRRCRDFDEKGYCMRGEMCPYDHGVDPVVLEDTALTRVLTFGPQGPNGAPGVDTPPVPPLLPPPIGPAPMIHPHMVTRPNHPEYNPSAPQMWHRPGFRGPRPMMGPRLGPQMGPFPPLPSMQRELISVPVTDNQNFKRQHEYDEMEVPMKKKTFDFNRLGPRNKNPINNCSLELKKIPRGLNNITHLNNHFAKFGKIVNIQVCFEGDPEGAIVTFSSHAEANAAYRSTEAVLNNRFIKVFWHSPNDGKQENVPPRTVKERLGQPAVTVPNSNKVLNLLQPKPEPQSVENQENVENQEKVASDAPVKTVYVPTKKDPAQTQESKALANAAIVKGQEILAAKEQLKKKHEEKRKEALKITQDLRKRKQELLEKQLAQQKLLIEKLEKTNPTGQQRDLLMSTIKTVQESIESIRKELLTQPPAPPKPVIKTKAEAQKEVLDAELDLITKQQEGGDTSELQKRLLELRAQANMLGARGRARGARRGRFVATGITRAHVALLSKNNLIDKDKNSAFPRGGATVRGATRGTFLKHTVDHRPTRLLVSGYEGDESDSVLAHFAQYGEISDYVTDDSTPSIILNYKTRKEAEVALLKGKNFQDRTLSVTWCNNAQLNNQRATSRTVLLSESTTDEQLLEQSLLEGDDDPMVGGDLSEAALLQDDEEEENDEENEDRSWRR